MIKINSRIFINTITLLIFIDPVHPVKKILFIRKVWTRDKYKFIIQVYLRRNIDVFEEKKEISRQGIGATPL